MRMVSMKMAMAKRDHLHNKRDLLAIVMIVEEIGEGEEIGEVEVVIVAEVVTVAAVVEIVEIEDEHELWIKRRYKMKRRPIRLPFLFNNHLKSVS